MSHSESLADSLDAGIIKGEFVELLIKMALSKLKEAALWQITTWVFNVRLKKFSADWIPPGLVLEF